MLRMVACLLALLALAGSALAGGGRPTTTVTYQPFGTSGLRPAITIDEALSGTCASASKTSPRRDAWRCRVADDVYDPCFSDPSGSSAFVVCPQFGLAPRSVDRIDLTSPLPAPANGGEPGARAGLPWLVLARPYAGYCSRITGSTESFAGKRAYYDCSLGGSLVGTLDRSSRRWTGKLLTEGDNPNLYTVAIRIAWY